jgi:hypothetical protein
MFLMVFFLFTQVQTAVTGFSISTSREPTPSESLSLMTKALRPQPRSSSQPGDGDMKKSLLVCLMIFSMGFSQAQEEKPIEIPPDHSANLRTTYDAALRKHYEVKLLEQKLNAARLASQIAFQNYAESLEATRQAVKAPKEWAVDAPVFSKFSLPPGK